MSEVPATGPVPRRYRMRRRREAMDATRDSIARAAFELHRDLGPAHATISAVAKQAGVERHTVYRHFPDLVELIRACTAHGMQTTGLPHPEAWAGVRDPFARLRTALGAMYTYWRANERLVGNILRDMPVMPELVAGSAAYQDHLARVWQSVLEPWASMDGPAGERVNALAATSLEFGTWQALTQRYGLSDDAAADAMVAAVRSAASSVPAGPEEGAA